jgi:hypothetical protein
MIEFCSCTESDYECDEGFKRPGIGEACVPVESSKVMLPITYLIIE